MPTHYELALMSQQVYRSNGGFVSGWRTAQYYEDNKGLATAVYKNERTNEMVIAFRGTNTGNLNLFIKNLISDLCIVLGKTPNTLHEAVSFVHDVRSRRSIFTRIFDFVATARENQLYLTGHSLGGMIAELVGYEHLKRDKKYKVITFESPGCREFIDPADLIRYEREFKSNFLGYLSEPNFINTRYSHIGALRRVHFKPYKPTIVSKSKYYINHASSCVIDAYYRILLTLLCINKFSVLVVGSEILPLMFLAFVSDALASVLKEQGFHDVANYVNLDDDRAALLVFCLCKLFMFAKDSVLVTSQQHSIQAFIEQFTNERGLPRKYSEVESWPTARQYSAAHLLQTVHWFHPFSNNNQGLRTIVNPEKMREDRMLALPGYKETKVVRNQ